jgi:hypothetical protein
MTIPDGVPFSLAICATSKAEILRLKGNTISTVVQYHLCECEILAGTEKQHALTLQTKESQKLRYAKSA